MKFGFPERCFKTHDFDFGKTGIFDEPQLDMLSALLTMAFYPNVYCHKGKTKVIFTTVVIYFVIFIILNFRILKNKLLLILKLLLIII